MSKHLFKRVLAIVMAVFMAISMFAVSAGASTESRGYRPYDPIDDNSVMFNSEVMDIFDALDQEQGATVTVAAQLVYRYGNFDNQNTAILEDVIDGDVFGIQVYGALSEFKIGDVLKVTGTLGA